MGRRQPMLALVAVAAAAALAVLWVFAAPEIAGLVGADAPDVLWMWLLICSGPTLLLAAACLLRPLHRRGAVRALIAGAVSTSVFWALFHGTTRWEVTHHPGGGANIGLGLLMLFSPVLVLAIMRLAYATGRRD